MCLATAFWGTAGGLVSAIHENGFAAAALLELVTGVLLTAIGVASGASLRGALRRLGWWLPLLAVAEAANAALYFVALHLAPIGLVMAMHLTSPVILAAIGVARGTRTGCRREMGAMLLVCTAIVMLTASRTAIANDSHVLVGMFLSLASAACLALFISIVKRLTPDTSPVMGAGVQMLVSGLILSPALLSFHSRSSVAELLLIALLLFAPAPWLYWRALRNISAIHGGTIQLLEPFFGSIVALAVYGTRPGLVEGVAASCILLASWLETGATVQLNLRERRLSLE